MSKKSKKDQRPRLKGAIALAMLSQLMAEVNGGWKPTFENFSLKQHSIYFEEEGIISCTPIYMMLQFLTFKTEDIAKQFLENHRELILKAKPLLGG